ncbi:MAG: lysylphosphatidylglycerol synthase domain-containing protein [Woeseiaceae bacterium]|nr:lysylphosphatidylglycerol synthase domain-containing protein [Woeseiaceae bacterium]
MTSAAGVRLAVRVLICIGIAWIVWLIYRDWADVREGFRLTDPAWALATLLLGISATLHLAPVFQLIVNRSDQSSISLLSSARLLFVGHMIRHVPGRFWGVVYQVGELRSHRSTAAMVGVNIEYMAITLEFAILVPLVVLCWLEFGPTIAAPLAVAGLLATAAAIRYQVAVRVLHAATAILPRKIAEKTRGLKPERGCTWREATAIVFIMASSWAIYLLAWESLGRAFPSAAGNDMLLLCATYSIAWAVGFVSFFTPSGLGVREAVFLFLTPAESLATLAFLAVIVRFWLLLNDILLSLIFLPFKLRPQTNHNAQ